MSKHKNTIFAAIFIIFIVSSAIVLLGTKGIAQERCEKYLHKGGEAIEKGGQLYEAIPWIDQAMETCGKNIRPFEMASIIELIFLNQAQSGKVMIFDILGLCNILKKVNMLGGVEYPQAIGGGTSMEKEEKICALVKDFKNNWSGEEWFVFGVSVMGRTNGDMSGMKRALPYFILAEKKGFKSEDLYQARGLIYYVQGNFEKAKNDFSKLLQFKEDAFTLRLLGKCQLLTCKSYDCMKKGLSTLRRGANLGDVEAKRILKEAGKILSENTDGLKRATWADQQVDNGSQMFGYTCNGEFMSVFENKEFLTSWLGNCGRAATIHESSVQRLAEDTCNCFMNQ